MVRRRKMKVLCDDREPKMIDVIVDLEEGFEIERKRLLVGDYVWKNVCIERKTIDDLCGSIVDGRIKNQVKKMKENFEHCFVLVAGKVKDRTSNIHENSVLGMMAKIAVDDKVQIICVDDDFQLVYVMKRIFERYEEIYDQSADTPCQMVIAKVNDIDKFCGDEVLGLKRYCLKHKHNMVKDFKEAIDDSGLRGAEF